MIVLCKSLLHSFYVYTFLCKYDNVVALRTIENQGTI